jgi:hypothetical protein
VRPPGAQRSPAGELATVQGDDLEGCQGEDTPPGCAVPVKAIHPARWSPAILDAIAPVIDVWRLPVHDPFAGTGERLGARCDQLGLAFTGTELEAPFIVDPRVRPGDSTSILTYPRHEYCVVCSPVYPNGMADHFRASDDSRRHTYRQALAAINGYDRPLAGSNMGRHGVRGGLKAEARHFAIADRVVPLWPIRAVVNVSDFIYNRGRYPLVQRWRELLERHGYVIADEIPVATPRNGFGANGYRRVGHEMVLVALRSEVAS